MTMRKRRLAATGAAFGLALLLAGSAVAVPVAKAKSYPTGAFVVAGHAVAAKDVLDARSIPDMAGKPSLMVTLSPAAAAAIGAQPSGKLPCALDGKPLGESSADTLASEHVLQLSGHFGDYDATAALARRISGHDPVPDSETDE
jgi:hypothetical protein